MRIAYGSTFFTWVVIIIASGDPKAEQLPFTYLVVGFLMILTLIEVVSHLLSVTSRWACRMFTGFATAVFLAHFYRSILQL